MRRKDIKKYPLTDTTLENLEAESKLYRVKDSLKLYFQVKSTGAKSWVMRYKKANGKWSWHGLGAYPLLSGKNARIKYHEKLAELSSGAEVLSAKPINPNAKTFQTVALEWFNTPKIQNTADSTKSKYISILEKHVFPIVGSKDISDINRNHWFKLLKDIQETVNPKTGNRTIETATRTRQTVNRVYRYAITQEIITTGNPLEYLEDRLETHEQKVMDHVSEEELPSLLNDIATVPSDVTRLGIQLLSHLFLRPSEVLDADWCEVDFNKKLWEIPAERMKKRRTHIIPLSNQVMALLTELKALTGYDDKLFPSSVKNPKDKNQRYRVALKKLGYKQTLHGFRHIASTKLNNFTDDQGNKFDERVVEFALAHKVEGVKGVYNKAEYLEDRRKLNQWYSDYLDSLQLKKK